MYARPTLIVALLATVACGVTNLDSLTLSDTLTAADVAATDDITVADDLAVTDAITAADITASDDLVVTDDATVTGLLTVTEGLTLSTIPSADLGATCTAGQLRIDTATTKELCYCFSTNVWYCWSATTATGPSD